MCVCVCVRGCVAGIYKGSETVLRVCKQTRIRSHESPSCCRKACDAPSHGANRIWSHNFWHVVAVGRATDYSSKMHMRTHCKGQPDFSTYVVQPAYARNLQAGHAHSYWRPVCVWCHVRGNSTTHTPAPCAHTPVCSDSDRGVRWFPVIAFGGGA